MIGKTVGHFKIFDKIGAGGMGVVYKAQDVTLDRIVALKSVLPGNVGVAGSDGIAQLIQEAKTASTLDHPNICTIHEVFQTNEGQVFIAMAYYEGETVAHKLRYGPLPVAHALPIAIDVASGLAKAHRYGIIHRDIKPSNIVVTIDGIAKILDFGIAKLISSASGMDAGVGTLAYMSPEQLRGEMVDQRADIWAWAVVLFEMLTGRTPWVRDSRVRSQAILFSQPDFSGLPSSFPPGLALIISKALQQNPSERYARVDDALQQLQLCWPHASAELQYRPKELGISPATPAIAVLPFRSLSSDPEDEYFSDGLTEELTHVLTHIDGLRVAARSSVFAFKGAHSPTDAAAKLHVEFLLQGSVRRSGSRLRINVQLVNVGEEAELWSESFDRDANEIFAVQEEIAAAVADRLKVQLTGQTTPHLVKRYTRNLQAYNLYLKGRYQWNRETPEALFQAIETYSQAHEADPSYVSALCGLAECYLVLGAKALLPPSDAWGKANEASKQAVELNPSLADPHGCKGAVLAIRDFDWPVAEQEFRYGLKLDPASALTRHWYAIALLAPQGRFHEALAEVARAIDCEPLSLIYNSTYAWICYLSQQWQIAADHCYKTLEIDPHHVDSLWCLGATLAELGQPEKGIAILKKLQEVSGDIPFVYGSLGHIYASTGKLEAAQEMLAGISQAAEKMYSSPICDAWISANLPGQETRALDCLEKAYESRDFLIRYIHLSPALRRLYDEPRFKELIVKMDLDHPTTSKTVTVSASPAW